MKLAPDLICKAAGIQHIDAKRLTLSQRFCEAVLEANRKINLVSRAGEATQTVERQFLQSIAALDLIPCDDELRWLDIGSGGGFPANRRCRSHRERQKPSAPARLRAAP